MEFFTIALIAAICFTLAICVLVLVAIILKPPRQRKSLPVQPPAPLLPAPEPPKAPRAPTLEERFKSVGVKVSRWTEVAPGVDGYSIDFKTLDPSMLGCLVVNMRDVHRPCRKCDYCDGDRRCQVYEIGKKPCPGGARDLGILEGRSLADFCTGCGKGEKTTQEPSTVRGALWHKGWNLFDILEELEKDAGQSLKSVRKKLIEDELGVINARGRKLLAELQRLDPPPQSQDGPYRSNET